MNSISDIIRTIQLTTNIYNTQINTLIKSIENISEDNKISLDKYNQIIYNTQNDLIEKISKDYNISSRELIKKYSIKQKKDKKSKDTIQSILESSNSFDNLANLSNNTILQNLTEINSTQSMTNSTLSMTSLSQDRSNSSQSMTSLSQDRTNLSVDRTERVEKANSLEKDNSLEKANYNEFDNYVDIEESPTMNGIIKMKNNFNDQSNSEDENELIDLLVQNKIEDTQNIEINQVTKSKRERGRKSKKNLDMNTISKTDQDQDEDIDKEKIYSNEVIYKSLTIKGNNYLLNLSTNEIYDMENILVGRKKGEKILFKKTIEI